MSEKKHNLSEEHTLTLAEWAEQTERAEARATQLREQASERLEEVLATLDEARQALKERAQANADSPTIPLSGGHASLRRKLDVLEALAAPLTRASEIDDQKSEKDPPLEAANDPS